MLHHLLASSPGDSVALEVLGDTSRSLSTGSQMVEEAKSTVTGSNPIADQAVPLWKTLGNWASAVKDGALDPHRTRFVLWVSRPFRGVLAERFSEASSESAARDALSEMGRILRLPQGFSTAGLAQSLRPHVDRFLSTQESNRIAIVEAFRLDFGSGDAVGDLRERVGDRFFLKEVADQIMNSLLGWVEAQVTALIQRNQPAVLHYDSFHEQAAAVLRRFNQAGVLESYARDPTAREQEQELATRTYVRQLFEVVDQDEDFELILEAIVCYLKSQTDQVVWADAGQVWEGSFEDFEQNLKRAWRRKRRAIDLREQGNSPRSRGFLLYSSCLEHQCKLQNMVVPDHFIPGSYHALSEDLEIGWHPDYLKLFAQSETIDK